ncbi:hypothetical protein AB9W56_004092 [Vibrio vulnificus]
MNNNDYCYNVRTLGLIAYLWIFFCGLYLTNLIPFSPVYIGFSILVVYSCVLLLFDRTLKFSVTLSILVMSTFYFLVVCLYSNISIALNVFVSFSSVMLVYLVFQRRKINFIVLVSGVLFNGLVLLFDGIWRLLNPKIDNLDRLTELGVGFQIYKSNSIMYADSNYVGLQAVLFFCFCLNLRGNINFRSLYLDFTILVLLVALLLSFSRAALLSMTVAIVFFLCNKNRNVRRLFVFLSPVFFVFAVQSVLSVFSEDVSFNSKFAILDAFLSYFIGSDYSTKLFGVGFGNADAIFGFGTHNLILTFLIESGIVGLLIFTCYLFFSFCRLKSEFLIVCVPFLIASMSLGATAIPYFFTMTTLAMLLKSKLLVLG